MTAAPARPMLHAMTLAQLKGYRRQLESAIVYFGRQHPVPPIHADLQARPDAITIVQAACTGSAHA